MGMTVAIAWADEQMAVAVAWADGQLSYTHCYRDLNSLVQMALVFCWLEQLKHI